jgi:thiamine monophosphate synthase
VLFGTVFRSSGKPAGHAVAGVELLREACAAADCPVLGIGGIDAERALDVVRAGAAGVAAISALLSVASPDGARDVVAGFRRAFNAVDRGC